MILNYSFCTCCEDEVYFIAIPRQFAISKSIHFFSIQEHLEVKLYGFFSKLACLERKTHKLKRPYCTTRNDTKNSNNMGPNIFIAIAKAHFEHAQSNASYNSNKRWQH